MVGLATTVKAGMRSAWGCFFPTRSSSVWTDLRTRMFGDEILAMICGITRSHMSISTRSKPSRSAAST